MRDAGGRLAASESAVHCFIRRIMAVHGAAQWMTK
jgi:hypothetical protein